MADVVSLYAAGTGGIEDASAMMDVQTDGDLIAIDWDWRAALNASETIDLELSFIATNQLTTNDVRGRISSISSEIVAITAVGVAHSSMQKFLSGFNISMAGGERLYLHALSSAGVVHSGRVNLYFDFTVSPVRRSARRR